MRFAATAGARASRWCTDRSTFHTALYWPLTPYLRHDVVDRRLHFLNARYVIAMNDERPIGETLPGDLPSVVPKKRDGEHAPLAGLGERRYHVRGSAARRDRHRDIASAPMCNELSQEDGVGANIVCERGDRRRLHGQ